MEFMNIGMITLITSLVYFKEITIPLLALVDTVKDQYPSFTPAWYMDTGKYICLLVFTTTVVANSADFNKFVKTNILRFLDRGCRRSIKKYPDDDDDEEVNTTYCKV